MADEELELELDVEEAPKSKKTLIIAIVVAVLLLDGGGAAWFFLSGSGEGGAEGEEKVDVEKLPLHYLTLTPEFVVNFGRGSRVRYLQVDIQIATRDEAALEVVANYKPVIRNDILVLLSGLSFEDLSQEAGKITLQKKILNTINKIVIEASHEVSAKDEDATNNHDETKAEGEHATKKDSNQDEVVVGPIENIYFTSFIMQ